MFNMSIKYTLFMLLLLLEQVYLGRDSKNGRVNSFERLLFDCLDYITQAGLFDYFD